MIKFPVPDVMKSSIYELSPRIFKNRGVRLLLLDVDNTIAPYGDNTASDRLILWANTMKAAGIELFILSNNRGDRPAIFAAQLGIGYIGRAKKPFTKIARTALDELDVPASESAVVGDQIYTDCLCAKNLGALAVVTKPLKFSNILLKARYWLEAPFRWAYKGKK